MHGEFSCITLCPRCRRIFGHRVRATPYYQWIKEPCDVCRIRAGFEYYYTTNQREGVQHYA